jgi:hypothetical protein
MSSAKIHGHGTEVMEDREYELKKAELALKEREVTAKEKESHVTWWKNPLIVGLIGATLALGGNIVTNILNNQASAEAERFRAQSGLVLSVIKTGGNEEDACKNLNFFVNIGWLDDPKGTIHGVCGTKGGIPTLPASSGVSVLDNVWPGSITFGVAITLNVRVEDADSHKPIEGAAVAQIIGTVSGSAVTNSVSRSAVTSAEGNAILNFVSSSDNLTVSKDGYQTVSTPVANFGVIVGAVPPTITIDLHRAPNSKH